MDIKDYGITRLVCGPQPFVAITKDHYDEIKNAEKFLFEAYYLEQKIDVVMEDFLELEMTLLSKAAQHMLYQHSIYPRMQNDVNEINRRIINLLSACRMYLDHYSHHLKNIYGEHSEKIEAVRTQIRAEYDGCLSYRTLEALRNFVQHRGFPVQSVTFGARREETSGKDWRVLFSVTPFIIIKDLEDDKVFKRTVIQELKKLGHQVDIKPIVREYITCIGRIHSKVREVIKSDVIEWEKLIQGAIDRFKREANTEDIVGLGIAARDEEGLYPDMLDIFDDFIVHRQELEQKNRFSGSLARLHVSGM